MNQNVSRKIRRKNHSTVDRFDWSKSRGSSRQSQAMWTFFLVIVLALVGLSQTDIASRAIGKRDPQRSLAATESMDSNRPKLFQMSFWQGLYKGNAPSKSKSKNI